MLELHQPLEPENMGTLLNPPGTHKYNSDAHVAV